MSRPTPAMPHFELTVDSPQRLQARPSSFVLAAVDRDDRWAREQRTAAEPRRLVVTLFHKSAARTAAPGAPHACAGQMGCAIIEGIAAAVGCAQRWLGEELSI